MNFNIKLPSISKKTYLVTEFGKINSDAYNNQQTIQAGIDYISENGGGTLKLLPTLILSGPITLKSNVCLDVVRNCYLKFPKEKRFYQVDIRNWEGMDCFRCNSPISAYNAHDIAIVGSGIIDGDGENWRPLKEWKVTERYFSKCLKKSPYYVQGNECRIWYPSKTSYEGCILTEQKMDLKLANDHYDFFRPVLLSLVECDRVLLKDIITSNSPAWNVHPLFCNNLTVDSVTIKNPFWAQNGDGIDIESCTNVEVKNSTFEVGDDGICIKSGKNAKARLIKRPTENVYIHDSIVYHAHGGIVIGSEMSRGVKNLLCENCTFVGTDIGIRFKSAIGRGGVVENIEIKNINMTDIINEAIIFNMDYSLYKMKHEQSDDVQTTNPDDIPYFKDILIENVNCDSSDTILKIVGINDETIKNITIKDSIIKGNKDYSIKNCKNIKLVNTTTVVDDKETYYENTCLECLSS